MNKNIINIKNRKASFDYFFVHEFVAGIQLVGTEVKAIRAGKVSLTDSYCFFKNGELYLKGMNITAGPEAFNHESTRDRKLLLNKKELVKLEKESHNVGLTIIVKKLFTNERNLVKVEIALAQGKKLYDKREVLKEKDFKRQIERKDEL